MSKIYVLIMLLQTVCLGIILLTLELIQKKLNLLWKCMRSFLDTMMEMSRQIDEFRKITEPEACKEEKEAEGVKP